MDMNAEYQTSTAFRRALEDRLKAKSRNNGIDLQRLRRQLAFDRLLCRLFDNNHTPWLLKGGYAMELRVSSARATKDIDLAMRDFALLGTDSEKQNDTILEMLQQAANKGFNDYFIFTVGAPILDLDAAPYGGARFPVSAMMDGRLFIPFHLDVGVGDVVEEPFEEFTGIDWLEFADIQPGKFKGISREAQFAEKLHAYTLPREQGSNSRVKDLVDMVLLVEQGLLDREHLKNCLSKTFKRRGTHELPEQFSTPPDFWKPIYDQLAKECNLDVSIEEGIQLLSKLWISLVK